MRVTSAGTLPVIEGTAEELVKLATAATAALQHEEAVAFHEGRAQIGVRLVGDLSTSEICVRCGGRVERPDVLCVDCELRGTTPEGAMDQRPGGGSGVPSPEPCPNCRGEGKVLHHGSGPLAEIRACGLCDDGRTLAQSLVANVVASDGQEDR